MKRNGWKKQEAVGKRLLWGADSATRTGNPPCMTNFSSATMQLAVSLAASQSSDTIHVPLARAYIIFIVAVSAHRWPSMFVSTCVTLLEKSVA
jgi:hypothetical protein